MNICEHANTEHCKQAEEVLPHEDLQEALQETSALTRQLPSFKPLASFQTSNYNAVKWPPTPWHLCLYTRTRICIVFKLYFDVLPLYYILLLLYCIVLLVYCIVFFVLYRFFCIVSFFLYCIVLLLFSGFYYVMQ